MTAAAPRAGARASRSIDALARQVGWLDHPSFALLRCCVCERVCDLPLALKTALYCTFASRAALPHLLHSSSSAVERSAIARSCSERHLALARTLQRVESCFLSDPSTLSTSTHTVTDTHTHTHRSAKELAQTLLVTMDRREVVRPRVVLGREAARPREVPLASGVRTWRRQLRCSLQERVVLHVHERRDNARELLHRVWFEHDVAKATACEPLELVHEIVFERCGRDLRRSPTQPRRRLSSANAVRCSDERVDVVQVQSKRKLGQMSSWNGDWFSSVYRMAHIVSKRVSESSS